MPGWTWVGQLGLTNNIQYGGGGEDFCSLEEEPCKVNTLKTPK